MAWYRKTTRFLPVILLVEAMILMMILAPGPAQANHSNHFLNFDSVRNGHIYYDDNMDRYHQSLKYADRIWSQEGSVKIRETPRDKKPTLDVRTYTTPNGLCGDWNPDFSPDRIRVSRPAIENNFCGRNAPDSVLLHEMGHALRIYDHTTGDYFYDVMYVAMVREFGGEVVECPLTLRFHDRHDYHYWWG